MQGSLALNDDVNNLSKRTLNVEIPSHCCCDLKAAELCWYMRWARGWIVTSQLSLT